MSKFAELVAELRPQVEQAQKRLLQKQITRAIRRSGMTPKPLAKALSAFQGSIKELAKSLREATTPTREEVVAAHRERLADIDRRATEAARNGELTGEQAYWLDRSLAHVRGL